MQQFSDLKSKERLLKLHGRWKSDIAKDMYIHEYINERLSVSKCTGLTHIAIYCRVGNPVNFSKNWLRSCPIWDKPSL